MKHPPHLITAIALTLSAWPLCAQEKQPERPPGPPQREGGPPRDAQRGGEGQRSMPGIFGALDANRDGAIDPEEMSRAADLLRRSDRNGDGRLTPGEAQPPGASQHPQAGGDRGGSREQGQRADGPGREQGPGREHRPDTGRAERPRGGDRSKPPRADASREQRSPGNRPDHHGDSRREGPQSSPPQGQAQDRGPRQGPPQDRGGDRFAQSDQRPDLGRGDRRPAWESGMRNNGGGDQQGPMAMGPRPDERRGPAAGGPRDLRRDGNARGLRHEPGMINPPGQRPPGPEPMHRPEGSRGREDAPRRDTFGPPPRGDRDHRPQSPRPPEGV